MSHEPGRGPGPASPAADRLEQLLATGTFAGFATVKRDGHPHLATMAYVWDPVARIARMTSVVDRVKPRHLARNPVAALYVPGDDWMSFAVAEGTAEVAGPSTTIGDDVGRELLSMQPATLTAADAQAFLRNMVEDRRVVIRLRVDRIYGGGLDV